MTRTIPLNARIDALIDGLVKDIKSCPNCTALRKAITKLEEIRQPSLIMQKSDIDPEMVDYFLTRNAALTAIAEPNATDLPKNEQRTEDNSTT